MERIQSINPERIAWCCADYEMTPGDLASELGISATRIANVMDGQDANPNMCLATYLCERFWMR